MSTLTLTLLRFAFLLLLWGFVFLVVKTIKKDIFGERKTGKKQNNDTWIPEILVVTQGNLQGTTLFLNKETVHIGRSPDSTLVLNDSYASARHARIYFSGDKYWLEDLSSTNGTWVGKTRVYTPTPLQAKTPIIIGETVMELQ